MPQHCKTKGQQKFVKNEYPLSAKDENKKQKKLPNKGPK